MNYKLRFKKKKQEVIISLPSSKSISNRLLIIQALAKNSIVLENVSTSDDTKHLIDALNAENQEINIGHAGTSMRFLTAFFSAMGKEVVLTGSERMKNRPIGILVKSLNALGSNIEYLEKEGFPPLKINKKIPHLHQISIDGSVSSQYISALLLIAPNLPNGLELTLTGKIVSIPYIKLTLSLMQHFGIVWTWEKNMIRIENQSYKSEKLFIESDWSGASYWYEIMALSNLDSIELLGLSENSLQGDSKLVGLFETLGISTEFGKNKAKLHKNSNKIDFFEYNFNEQPDIAQTFAVLLCLLDIPFHFFGLETLKIKESNRIEALINELAKLGFQLNEPQHGELAWSGKKVELSKNQNIEIETYNDHRMALAFATASILFENLIIKDAGVVSKSYPEFWEHIEEVGFTFEEVI